MRELYDKTQGVCGSGSGCGTSPDVARPAVTATSAHPREVQQRDAVVDLLLRKSRQAVSPRKPDAPTAPVSSVVRGGPERTGPRPPPWVPLLRNLMMVAVSFPPV